MGDVEIRFIPKIVEGGQGFLSRWGMPGEFLSCSKRRDSGCGWGRWAWGLGDSSGWEGKRIFRLLCGDPERATDI